MKKIIIINGPNLNLVGIREPDKYGTKGFDTITNELSKKYSDVIFEYFQSNIEGEIIDKLHETGFSYFGIIINAGGYSHTSVAISDAIASINTPVIEVHMTNIHSREEYRHCTILTGKCKGVIAGFGMDSYFLAVEAFMGV